jgi:hypothetical protein
MAKENRKFVPDLQAIRAVDLRIGEFRRVWEQHTGDETTQRLIEAEIDRLVDERARFLGLPEDEIARINQESEEAAEAQVKAEIEQFLHAIAGIRNQ